MELNDTLRLIAAIVIGYAVLFLTMWIFKNKNKKDKKLRIK
ncbi:MAG: hypothetical protein AABX17_03645 [Nanoarchaeota archaeon]